MSEKLGLAKKARAAAREELQAAEQEYRRLEESNNHLGAAGAAITDQIARLQGRIEEGDERVNELASLCSADSGLPTQYYVDGESMGGPRGALQAMTYSRTDRGAAGFGNRPGGCIGDAGAGFAASMRGAGTAADRAGPRLTVFSPTTGQRFEAVRKGERLAAEESPVSLGDFVVGAFNGSWGHIAPEARAQAISLAQQGGSIGSGGLFLNEAIWPQHFDAIRARSRVFEAGLQTILVDDMPVGALRVTQTVSGPTPQWLGELQAATASAISFKALNLVPAKLACYVPCSRELLADSVNAGPAIEQAILGSMAAEIDRACLLGSGAGVELQGVANHPDVQTVASVGTPTDFAELISALQKIYAANYDGPADGLSWLYSPREMATFGALVDLQGQPLQEPKLVADLQHLVASALPTDEGAGSNESRMVVGPFDQSILFVRQRPQIEVLREGSIVDADGATLNATSQDAVVLRCTMRVALAILRPTWFAVLSGVTAAS